MAAECQLTGLQFAVNEGFVVADADEPIRSKGATHYDIVGMSDEKFEAMMARLVRLELPEARRPAATGDGGADRPPRPPTLCAWRSVESWPRDNT